MAKYIIDTHSLVWFLSDPSKLRVEQRKAFRDVSAKYYIPTRVFEEIRYKFEKFKKDGKNKGAIKVPPIVAWRIAKRCNNITIIRLDKKEINKWIRNKPRLKEIKRDDLAFAVLQLILQERYPRTEVKIITNDEIIKKHPLTKTI